MKLRVMILLVLGHSYWASSIELRIKARDKCQFSNHAESKIEEQNNGFLSCKMQWFGFSKQYQQTSSST